MPALIAGDHERILSEWRSLIGDPTFQPEDLSRRWPVHLGTILEGPILEWHSSKTGQVFTRTGEVVEHPDLPWLSCTLDAWREADRCCLDVKVCHGYQSLDEIVAYYTPQLVVQKACTRADRAAILLMHGSAEPREIEAYLTPDYEDSVLSTAAAFWACVESMRPPVDLPSAPVPPERWRRIELDTEADLYNWSGAMKEALQIWRETAPAAARCEAAKTAIKAVLPDDVGRVRYSGAGQTVIVARARNGAVTIKVEKV